MNQTIAFSAADLQEAMRQAKGGSKKFVTNFFAPPAQWSDWIRRGLRPLIPGDNVLLLTWPEENCTRLFFAGDRHRLELALSQNLSSAKQTVAVDLVGRPPEVADLSLGFSTAGFRPHARLIRLSCGRRPEFAETPSVETGCDAGVAGDVPAVIRLLHGHFDYYADQIPRPDAIQAALEQGELCVVRQQAQVGGFLWYAKTGATALIRYWCVDPAARGQGVGSRLMKDYFTRTGDCTRHLLWVRDNNPTAAACYHHYGYRPDGLEDLVLILEK